MNAVRHKHASHEARRSAAGVMALVSLMTLSIGRAAAQSEPAAAAGRPDGRTEPIDEIEVVGHRPLRDLRIEVQAARERVYDLFNSLNSNDEFDIHCRTVPKTGTRIPQRDCRPQYADNSTSEAGKAFARRIQRMCPAGGGISGECLEAAMAMGSSEAQAIVSRVPGMDHRLDVEIQRLARENPEFRRVIAGYETAERRYAVARGAGGSQLRASVSIISAAGAAMPSGLAVRQGDVVSLEATDLVTPEIASNGPGDSAPRVGWVKLRYSVLADGSTADVRVVDLMPPGLDPLSAIAAAQAWTFEPATQDGVPIDWHNNLAVIVFDREQAVDEHWDEFADAYDEVTELISGEQYEQARLRNEGMQRVLAVTLDEMAFAEMQRAAIEHALGNPYAALDAIRRATEPSVHQLADEELKPALALRFSLELQLGLAVDALETYERRVRLGDLPSGDPLARLGAALEQALEAPESSLAEHGRIGGNGQWEHGLTWRTFTVDDVDGRTEGLGVECNGKKGVLPYEPNVEMTIPAGWGECVVFVSGEPDTTFTLYEFRQPVQ